MKPKSSICRRCHRLAVVGRTRYCSMCEGELRKDERLRAAKSPGIARSAEEQEKSDGSVNAEPITESKEGGARKALGETLK